MSFHQLCYRQVEKANHVSGRDLVTEAKVTYPGKDLRRHEQGEIAPDRCRDSRYLRGL